MKTVLIIQHFFLPLNGVSVKQFAGYCRHLPQFGWRPVVLTRDWSGGSTQEADAWGLSLEPDAMAQLGPATTVVAAPHRPFGNRLQALHERLKASTGASSPRLRRLVLTPPRKALSAIWPLFGAYPDALVGWVDSAVAVGATVGAQQRVAAVISNCPPQTNHLVAARLARRLSVPWVPYFGDLYGFYVGSGDWHAGRWRRSLAWCMNRLWLRRAAHVLAVSPHMVKLVRRLYGVDGDVVVVGFDEEEFQGTQTPRGRPTFRIAHVGSIYPGDQRPDLFLDGLDRFLDRVPNSRQDLEIRFVGSRCESDLRQLLADRPCSTVSTVTPKVSAVEAIRVQLSSDALLLLNTTAGRAAGGTLSYPSKLFEYLGARRPILAVPGDGDWVDGLLQATQAGVVADSADEVCSILETWYTQWLSDGTVPYQGCDDEIARFTRVRQTARIAAVLDRVTGASSTGPASQ